VVRDLLAYWIAGPVSLLLCSSAKRLSAERRLVRHLDGLYLSPGIAVQSIIDAEHRHAREVEADC